MTNKKINEIESRVIRIEQRYESEKKIQKRMEEQKRNEVSFGEVVFFYIMTPITLLGYFIASIIYVIIKPIKMYGLTFEEKKKYYVEGKFYSCEYMWGSISSRNS